MTAIFAMATRNGVWRVTLNGLFFGDYPSAALAENAITEAQEIFAPQSAEAKQNDNESNAHQ